MNRPKKQPTLAQQARLGLFLLKDAILEVLFRSRDEGPLQSNEITTRLGIPEKDKFHSRSNNVIVNILTLMQSEGCVEYVVEVGNGWIITETGASQLQM